MVEFVDRPHIRRVFLVSHSSGGYIVWSIIQLVFTFFIRIWTKICVCFMFLRSCHLLQWNGLSIVSRIVLVTNGDFVYVCVYQLSTSYQPVNVYFLLPLSTIYKVFLCFYYNLFCIYMDFRISTSDAPSDLYHMSHVIWGFICVHTHTYGVTLLRSNDLPSVTMSHYYYMSSIHAIYTYTIKNFTHSFTL